MRIPALSILAALTVSGCISKHLTMEIPPPGGCDQCHHAKIAGNWEVRVAPVVVGKEGGAPEPIDSALRSLQAIPYHKEVPVKRLAVYAASAPPEAVGDEETGVQCFVCHESDKPPHEQKMRGRHPWERGSP